MRASLTLIFASLISFALSALASDYYAFPYGDADVSVVSTQSSGSTVDGSDTVNSTVSVLLAVRNKAFKKAVGIRFTNNTWATYNEAFGSYFNNIDANFELWVVEIDRGTRLINETVPEYIVAGFVSYNQGARVWDPRNDYYVFEAPSQQNPVYLLTKGKKEPTLTYEDSSKKIVLSGTVRTYTADRKKRGSVTVRWTTDDWKTYQDSAASPTTLDSWNIKIPVAKADLSLPATVQFAIQHKNSAGVSFWLNNDNKNFVKTLKGNVSTTNLDKAPTFNGINPISFSVDSDIPLGYRARIDNGEWKEFNLKYYLNTANISNGNHTLEIGVNVQNGPEILRASYPIVVDNHITFRSHWEPKTPTGLEPFAWSAAASAGKVFIGYGSGTAARFSSVDPSERVAAISVEAGNVYILVGTNVHKFDEKTGKKDTTFAINGILSLNATTPYDGTAVCNPNGVVVIQERMFISDSCNLRILWFTAAGAYDGRNLGFNSDWKTASISRTSDSKLLQVFQGYRGDLIVEEFHTVGYFGTEAITFLPNLPGVTSPIVKSDSFILNQGNELVFAKDGEAPRKWKGDGPVGGVGNLNLARGVAELGDGTVFVLNNDATLQRFDVKLV
ncbi:hypothetical protein HDU97_009280 [Phlyctochytrium planicorne]|nr:hypothetical protein HDU97_009280 [Phlyctochytrium planicorne]